MLQAILPFLTAIALSAIAAFYSVIGLAQIFPGSFWPIILMGSVLEVAKLVTVSWLYNNWIVVGANSVQIKTLNTQEKIAKDRLEYLLKRAGDPTTASNKIDKQIQDTQVELTRLSKEKLPLMTEENKLTAEIGPIKYIAEIFYNKDDAGFIDKAVRLVIFTIIIVFDPLAILLLIASNQTYRKLKILPEEIPTTKKARKKKRLDNQPSNSLESFYVDGETHELIPKNKITTLDGGSF